MRSSTGPARSAPRQDWSDDTRPSVETRYRAARRHSVFVRIFKYGLPIVSVAGVVGFLAYTYLVPELPQGFSFGSIDVTHNSVIMQNPHVSGFTNNGRAYELKADRAEQSLTNTKMVTLQTVGATIGMENNGTAKVAATGGTYDSDKQRLTLTKDVTLSTTSGVTGKLQQADINLKSGTMTSDRPIDFTSQGSRIQANSLEVQDRGARLLFRNGVKVLYASPSDPIPANPQAGSSSVTQ